MKKIRTLCKALAAICLILCLCAGLGTPALAAPSEPDMSAVYDRLFAVLGISQSDYDNYDRNYSQSLPIDYTPGSSAHYVALGGVTAGGLAIVRLEDCYADLLAARLEIETYDNLGMHGVTSQNLVSYVKKHTGTYAGADLITLQLDGATFISTCTAAAQAGNPVTWTNYIADSSLLQSLQNFKSQMLADYGAEYGEKTVEGVSLVLEHMLYECVAYCIETMNAVREIRKVNSDAAILVPGLYNPLRGLKFTSSGKSLNVSALVDEMIDFCNVYLLVNTMNMKNTAFVEASGTATAGFGTVALEGKSKEALDLELQEISIASDKQYANKTGHAYLCSQLFGALYIPCPHTETEFVGKKDATCKDEGYSGDISCSQCGEVLETGSSIPKIDHNFGAWAQTKAPACTEEGEESRTCTVCGHKEAQAVPATGHVWDNGTVTKQPGCESEGTKTYSCTASGCKETKTESIPAVGHAWNNGTVTKEPGCETEGTKTYSCTASGCKETKTESIPAAGHSLDSGSVTKEPGCESEGVKAFTCTACGKAVTEAIPATGHTLDGGTVTKEPGCESEGVKSFTCAVCGKTVTEDIPATGHTWNEGTVTLEPDCESEGEKAFTCTVCGKEKTEVVPAAGHTWNEGTMILEPGCESEGEKAYICTVCGAESTEILPPAGHAYGDYISNEDATCQQDGTRTALCSVCGTADTVTDPGTQRDHDYVDGICSFCGAEKPSGGAILWIVIAVVAVGAVCGGLFFLKAKKGKTEA